MKLTIDITNRRTLVKSLNNERFKVAVEVGVRTGWFSKYILDHTRMKVYAIDPWVKNAELMVGASEVYQECKERLAPYQKRCEMVRGFSPAEANRFDAKTIDFVYIDGLHDYESVKKDMLAWWNKVTEGGILAGHDYNEHKWPGVVKAVKEFSEVMNIKYYLCGVVGNAYESRTGDLDEYDGDEYSWFFVKGKKRVE